MVLSFLKALECGDKSQLTDKIGSSDIPCPVLLACSTISFCAQHSHLHQAPLWGVQEQETCKGRELWGEKWLSRGCEAHTEPSLSAQELCQESEHSWGALSPALWCSERGCCWRSFNNLPLKGCCLASLQARTTTQFKHPQSWTQLCSCLVFNQWLSPKPTEIQEKAHTDSSELWPDTKHEA